VATDASLVSPEEARRRVTRTTLRNLPFAALCGCLVGWWVDGAVGAAIGGALMAAFMMSAGLLAFAAWRLRH
jgi:hypothetical protein